MSKFSDGQFEIYVQRVDEQLSSELFTGYYWYPASYCSNVYSCVFSRKPVMSRDRVMSPKEVQELFGRTDRTIRRWRHRRILTPILLDIGDGSPPRTVGYYESQVMGLFKAAYLAPPRNLKDELSHTPVTLNGRAWRVLEDLGIDTPAQLAQLDLDQVSQMRGVGTKTIRELKEAQRWARGRGS